jgi:hypothetical protein
MVMSSKGIGTKNHCAGEGQQPFCSQLGKGLPTVQETSRIHRKINPSPRRRVGSTSNTCIDGVSSITAMASVRELNCHTVYMSKREHKPRTDSKPKIAVLVRARGNLTD